MLPLALRGNISIPNHTDPINFTERKTKEHLEALSCYVNVELDSTASVAIHPAVPAL